MHLRNISLAAKNALLAGACIGAFSFAGPVMAQAPATGGTPPPNPSRFDLYGGYGYIHPVDSDINHVPYLPIQPGAVANATLFFNRYLGFQAEGSYFPKSPNHCIYTGQAGLVLRYPAGRFVPFMHALGGAAKVGGPSLQPCTWGWGATGGIGIDYILPMLNNHLAVRPIQADFDYSRVNYGPLIQPADVQGGFGEIQGYKLSAGLVLRLGATSVPPPVQLGCTVQPVDVYPGDPVQVTAVPANLNLKRAADYTWNTTGGQVKGTGETAAISTAGLNGGDYTVSGHVSQGPRPSMQAGCTASFRVHNYDPPVLTCSANPTTLLPGQTSTITATGNSPQNRSLSYSFTATSGQIQSNGNTATLTTVGGQPGTVAIVCNVVDDLGKQASATTAVGINVPPAPPAPQTKQLCSVGFDRDRRHPVRVDNEAKGCLDDIALTLNRDSTSRLVLVGHHSSNEKPDAAAQRTLNVEQYLVDEKGIDPLRIDLRTGGTASRHVDSTLVPSGATFDFSDTQSFDGSSIRRQGQAYGKARSGTRR